MKARGGLTNELCALCCQRIRCIASGTIQPPAIDQKWAAFIEGGTQGRIVLAILNPSNFAVFSLACLFVKLFIHRAGLPIRITVFIGHWRIRIIEISFSDRGWNLFPSFSFFRVILQASRKWRVKNARCPRQRNEIQRLTHGKVLRNEGRKRRDERELGHRCSRFLSLSLQLVS